MVSLGIHKLPPERGFKTPVVKGNVYGRLFIDLTAKKAIH